MMLYICNKFCENISKRFQSYWADTISKLKFSKGHNALKDVCQVMVLNLCTSFDDTLYLYHVS